MNNKAGLFIVTVKDEANLVLIAFLLSSYTRFVCAVVTQGDHVITQILFYYYYLAFSLAWKMAMNVFL